VRGAVAAALAADLLWGEPSAALHPTVWMGRWFAGGRARRRSRGALPSLAEGAALVGSGVAGAALLAGVAERAMRRLPRGAAALARGAMLKPAMALHGLLRAAMEVERSLAAGDLPEARRLLAWHLVSRDTADLTGDEVAAAAIESLAENLGDGVVAPLLAFRAGGLAAAYAFRAANTADSLLGYRTAELEWFGKPAARFDDLLSWAPARLSAVLIAAAAPLGGGSTRAALRCALRDGGRTPSPNAGWPMAAMAGALGVRLAKRDAYVLHPSGRPATHHDLRRARRIVAGAALLAVPLLET
jgi:adenosylcobinamide-phosphate synthase